jgi:polyhydroxyalkanoate synthesis regulator phasin
LAILILILFFLVALCPVAPNSGFTGTAAALSMITAVAVGIERIIEAFWTIIGMTKGAFWPLNLINEQVNGMVNSLDDKLHPVYEEAEKAMNELVERGEWTTEKLAEAKKELDELKARTAQLKALAPDNQRVNMIAASAFQSISLLEKKYPQVAKNAEVAHQAIVGVSDFVATFKDNPGRRLISILLGMILGLLVAGVVRLDVFLAASDRAPGAVSQTKLFGMTVGLNWAVAFTGLLIGLGSNPTHEVIRAIQEYKKTRKSDNDPAPVTVQTEGGGSAANFAVDLRTTRVAAREVNTFSLRRRM